MRPTKDGRVALLAYTALDRLVTGCGPRRPAIAWAGTALYESVVPQATREAIDEGAKDIWSAAADGVQDRWEVVFG